MAQNDLQKNKNQVTIIANRAPHGILHKRTGPRGVITKERQGMTKKVDIIRTTKSKDHTPRQNRLAKKVTQKRVDAFYSILGLSGIQTLPAFAFCETYGNSVITANSGV